jgi:hypothetical protein
MSVKDTHPMILDPSVPEAPRSDLEGVPGTWVAGGMIDTPLEPVQELPGHTYDPSLDLPRGPAGLLMMDRSQLSPRTLKRITAKYKLKTLALPEKPEHHMTRKAKRREMYRRFEAKTRNERYERLRSTVEGMWKWYKWYVTSKGCSWEITLDEWTEVMETEVDGTAIAYYDIYILRIDKKNKLYSISNIYIVDRYTKKELYRKA